MPTADATKREYTTAETEAYERYISAATNHNIVCARAGATTKEKMDAAFAADAAFREFSIVAGMEYGRGIHAPADLEKIKALEGQLDKQTEDIRSARAMICAAAKFGFIEQCPEGVDVFEHDACACLIRDAALLLRVALGEAYGL